MDHARECGRVGPSREERSRVYPSSDPEAGQSQPRRRARPEDQNLKDLKKIPECTEAGLPQLLELMEPAGQVDANGRGPSLEKPRRIRNWRASGRGARSRVPYEQWLQRHRARGAPRQREGGRVRECARCLRECVRECGRGASQGPRGTSKSPLWPGWTRFEFGEARLGVSWT